MPVSNLALTTPRRRPKRAAVLGVWNRSLVMTSSTTPDRRCRPSRILVTWLEFCTAHSRRPSNTMPSTVGTLTPAMVALAPVLGSTEYRAPLAEWATIRVLPLAVARSEEHTSELQSHSDLVCRLLLEKKKKIKKKNNQKNKKQKTLKKNH